MKTNTNTTKTRIALGIGSLIALNLACPLQAETKIYQLGNSSFGANLTGAAYATYGIGNFDATISGKVNGTLMTKSFNLASGEAKLHLDRTTKKVTNSGNLVACGKTLVNWGSKPSDNGNFSTGPLFNYMPGGTYTFTVGPVPVTVQVGALIDAYAQGTAVLSISNGQPVVTANFGPKIGATVLASAGVGLPFASAGVEGAITLCRVGLGDTVNISPYGYGLRASNSVDLWVDGPSGKISLYAQLGWGPFSTRPTQTICSFNTGSWKYPLARNTFTF